MDIIHFFLLLLAFFLFIFLLFKLGSRFSNKRSSPNLPPGPMKLPFIGNLHNLIGELPHRALQGLSLKHGPLMHLQLGELSVVVVSSPETAKQVMKTHDLNFASRATFLAAEIITYGCKSISFSPYGEYWRHLRKICTLELLSLKRVQSFRTTREEVFSDATISIASEEGSIINLTRKFQSLTYAVTSRTIFGKNIKEREALTLEIIKEVVLLATGLSVSDLFPSIKFLDTVTGMRQRAEKLHKKIDRLSEDIIHEHEEAIDVVKSDGTLSEDRRQEDLIDVLLKYRDESLQLPLTNDNIKAISADMMGAGSETSATTLDWAMVEMLKNPRTLEKAQAEVRRVFDEKGYVDESNIHELKYLKSVIKETLRLHPPLPLLLPRRSSEKCEINGYEIPINTKIIVNAWAVSRDPKYWKNAESFEPERFVDDIVDYKGNYFEYIPFGAGRRMCPGMTYGLANIELPLAMFLYHFDWKLPAGMKHEEMDMTERFGLTVSRRKSLHVVPVIKRPLPAKWCI